MLIRGISILVGAPLFLTIVLWPGGWAFAAVVALLTVLMLREFYDGCRLTGARPAAGFGYFAALVMLASCLPLLDSPSGGGRGAVQSSFFAGPASEALFLGGLALLFMGSMVVELGRGAGRAPLRNLGPTWLGVLYVGWLFPFSVRVRFLTTEHLARIGWENAGGWIGRLEPGASAILLVLLLTWATDTTAYLVGKSVGKHKMAPALSPGKTWEGAVGGFIGAMVVAASMGPGLGFPLPWSLVLGALIGIVAQLGDLCKSAIKREVGVKDFGNVLPGHGGMLDRFDSLLFTGTTCYFLWLLWPWVVRR